MLSGLIGLALSGCASLPRSGRAEAAHLFAALQRCGVRTGSGSIAYDPAQALLTMTQRQKLPQRATWCMASVLLDRGLDLKAADPLFALEYARAWERANAGVGPKMARLWIHRNIKQAVPRFRPGPEAVPVYVRRLERLCNAPAGSVGATEDAVRVPWLEGDANEAVSCVYLAALASNLAEAGVRVESVKEPQAR